MQKALLAVAMAAGLLIAWADSRPGWDDAGMTAAALVVAAAVVGFSARRRPWLFGLAVGLWIPLGGLVLKHDARFLLVLIFPMAGAYAGWSLGKFARKWPASS